MVRDFSKLLLRAYNAEADNLVRSLKPYKLDAAVERLTKVSTTIARLGKTMDIAISAPYHQLRILELELTADYLAKVAEEKEREREEEQRLREERQAQQEMKREKARLEKERQQYLNARQALIDKGDTDAAERLQDKLDDITRAIEDVDLATGMHGQPGVYALLPGSGVSTGAGIPTGWGVVTELVRRAAAASAPDDATAAVRAAADPEA